MDKEKKLRLVRAAAALLLLGAACLFLVLVLRPPCVILQATGFYCPGCGGQRMLSALLRGDLPQAFRRNPFLFCILPLAAAYAVAEAVRYTQKKRPLYQSKRFPAVLIVILVLALVFAVLRNLPGFEFLGP